MTDPTIELLRELRPTDADHIDEIFPAEQRTAQLEAILASGQAHQVTRDSNTEPLEAPARVGPGERRRRLRVHHRLQRPLLTSAIIAGGMAALALAVTGAFSGEGPTGVATAQAAVVRGAIAALQATPGSILVESYTTFWPAMGQQRGFYQHQEAIYETPAGSGAQNFLISYGPGTTETVTFNGNVEDYDPSYNTIYTAVDINACGCKISAGSSPDTYIVTLLKIRGARPGTAAWEQNEHLPRPLTITAAQAQALRDGSAMLNTTGVGAGGTETRLEIVAAFRVPSENRLIQTQLQAHKLELDGTTSVDGRDAIKLSAADGTAQYYVAPGTYYPIKTVVRNPGGGFITTLFSQYQVMPITPASQRLLSLTARHPSARIDNSHADYVAAEPQLSRDSWPRATHADTKSP